LEKRIGFSEASEGQVESAETKNEEKFFSKT